MLLFDENNPMPTLKEFAMSSRDERMLFVVLMCHYTSWPAVVRDVVESLAINRSPIKVI